MATFNFACIGGKVDQKTGCYQPNCDEYGIFEACRQSFYLKQQNEILQQSSQQQQATTSANSNQKIKDLESRNIDFQKITNQQNQQIAQLIQSSEQTAHKIENLNLINIILIAVLVIVVCTFFIVKFMKRRNAVK